MTIFVSLLLKVLPLYLFVLIGYLAGKHFRINKEAVSNFLLYIIFPVIVFNGVYSIKIDFGTLSLPLLFFLVASTICLTSLYLTKYVWKDSETRGIFALMSAQSNMGYFGFPIVAALYGEKLLGIAALCSIGSAIYESSVGYYVGARGKYSVKESIRRLLKLPALYAISLGLIVNYIGWQPNDIYLGFYQVIKSIFFTLGMMMVGLAVSDFKKTELDRKFTFLGLFTKFIIWPALVGLVIFVDSNFLRIYSANIYKVMFLLSIVPIAVNAVIFSTQLKAHPKKVSFTVLVSTVIALFYIPLMVALFVK